jgi:hypothetical protein
MKGTNGKVTIQLVKPIVPKSFAVDHVSRKLTDIPTMLKNFRIYGLDHVNAEPVLLGTFRYEKEGTQTQVFRADGNTKTFPLVQFEILDNWGRDDYTCIYRVRVFKE